MGILWLALQVPVGWVPEGRRSQLSIAESKTCGLCVYLENQLTKSNANSRLDPCNCGLGFRVEDLGCKVQGSSSQLGLPDIRRV